MTSTNDGKDVKSNITNNPKGKTYLIEIYKSLEARLNEDSEPSERTKHVCEAWRRVHSLCQHSAPSTHAHLINWLHRHTARTVLQTEWQTDKRKDDRKSLEEAINDFITEVSASGHHASSWGQQLVSRGQWFKRVLDKPWEHPVLTLLLNPSGAPPTLDEVLIWLKEERGVTFVVRLHTLVREKCDDIAVSLATAVMERVRDGLPPVADSEEQGILLEEKSEPSFGDKLKEEAGFTPEVLETLTDIEFVLLHKRDSKRCIALAKRTPLLEAYPLIERLQKRLEASPREKRLWKNGREVAVLIAQVVIARCMMVKTCANAARTALYCCSRLLAGLLISRLPEAADALAAQAPTARHLHTLAQAVDKQLSPTQEAMKPYVCELFVRALTAGMNELERLKLKTEKQAEALSMEKTLASWFVQLGMVLSRSDRIACECTLTAFSLHPSQKMYERIDAAPPLAPLTTDQESKEEPITSEFGSWANDSRSQTNLVKTSETLNLKHTQNQANVLSTAIFNEGEALGLSPELCQDIAVLLSGPRVKTLSWDMDRTLLLENCRAYSEKTHGGTRSLTRELKYLNIDLKQYQHLPEEKDDDENDPYYGIEKGYEHLAILEEPEDIWADVPDEKTDTASSIEEDYLVPRRKKKIKRVPKSSDEDSNPLIVMAQAKRTQKKKERPHSKERSKERAKKKQEPVDPLDLNTECTNPSREVPKEPKPKKERKKKEKVPKVMGGKRNPIARLLAERNKPKKKPNDFKVVSTPVTDSDYDSQGKNSVTSLNSEGHDHDTHNESVGTERISAERFGVPIMTKNKSASQSTQRRPHNLSKMQYRPQTSIIRPQTSIIRPQTPNALWPFSPIDAKTSDQKKYTDEVRASLSRLLEIKRQREFQHKMMIQNNIQSPPRLTAIHHPEIPLQTNISPKTVAIPEIPKSYINKDQIEQHAAYLRAQKEEVLQNSVIQYAKKTGGNKSRASTSKVPKNKTHQSNFKMTDIVNVNTPYDRLMAEISERHDRETQLKTQYIPQPVHSPMSAQRSYNVTTPGQRDFQNFLKDYDQKKFMSARPIDMSSKPKEANKKPVMPVSRVAPITPSEPKDEPKSVQSSKQPMQQKKPEASLNTFSRLSYMHKNKHNEMKNKALIQKPTCSTSTYQEVSSELDEIIKEHLLQQMRVIQAKRENADRSKPATHEPIRKSESVSHPLLSNLLASPSKTNMSHYQNESLSKTNPVQPKLQGKSSSLQYVLPVKSTPVQQNSPYKSTAQQILTAKSVQSQTMTDRSTPVLQTSTGRSTPMHQTYPGKSTSLQQTLPQKSTSGQQNIPVKSIPKQQVMTANLNSSLSEKDQNDILNLLLQQNKLKGSTSMQYSTNINSKPSTSSITKSQSTNDYNASVSLKQYPSSKSVMKETSIKSILETKIINVLSNTLLKPGTHEINKSLSLSVKPSDSKIDKKPKCSSSQDKDKKNVSGKHNKPETPEWQTVMQEILKHKTPCRGPKATNVTLEKTSFEKCSSESSLLRQNQPSNLISAKNQDKVDRQKPVITSIQNVIITKKGIKLQDASNLHKNTTADSKNTKLKKPNTSETAKKLPQEVQRKQFTYTGPKHNDPFISGIPHSDYDLLEELMDDDLRKEIGELSSDEESYNEAAQSFLKSPKNKEKTRVSVQYNKSASEITSVKPTTDMQSKSRQLNNEETRQNESISVLQRANDTTLCDSLQIRPAHIPHDNLTPTSHSSASHISISSNSENQTYTLTNNQVLMDPNNIYISAVPQPTPVQNVVLVDSGMLYGRYSNIQTPIQTMSNMEHNAYVAVNSTPTMTLYQTTQYASPVVIRTPVAVPVINNILVQPNSISNMPQIAGPPVIAEPLPSAVIAESTESRNTYTETTKNTYTETSDKDVESDNAQQIDPSQEDKNCERKVLFEVQDFILTEKIDNTSNHMIKDDINTNIKKEASADQERLKRKRLAIINREIYHQCLSRIIPLSYTPLPKTETELKENNFTQAIPQCYSHLQPQEAEKKLPDNEEQKLQIKNDLQDLSDAINEVPSPVTPDSTDSKENKNTPASPCRRILLRSSNKIMPKSNTECLDSEMPVTKKSKGKLKSGPKEATARATNKTTNGKAAPKRISKRLNNKKLTKTAEEKKLLEKQNQNSTTDHPLPKKTNKNFIQSKTETRDMESFDIEAQLQGSIITKSKVDMAISADLVVGNKISDVSTVNNKHAPQNTTRKLLDIEKVPEPMNDFKIDKRREEEVVRKTVTDKKSDQNDLESVTEKTIDDKIVQEQIGQNEKTKVSVDKVTDDKVVSELTKNNKIEDSNKILIEHLDEQANEKKENEALISSESVICDNEASLNDPTDTDSMKTCDKLENLISTPDIIDSKSEREIENDSNEEVQPISITTAKNLTTKEDIMLTREISEKTQNAVIKEPNKDNSTGKDNIDLDMTVTCEEVPKLSPTFGSIRTARSKPINVKKKKKSKVSDNVSINKDNLKINKDLSAGASCIELSNSENSEIEPIIETVSLNPTPDAWLKLQTELKPKLVSAEVFTRHTKTLTPTKDSEAIDDDVVIINDNVEVKPEELITNAIPKISENIANKEDSTMEYVNKAKTQPKIVLGQTSDEKVQQKTKNVKNASNLSDISKLPQDFKDKFRIESLPSNDPTKQTVRVWLPNGRKIRATVRGLSSTVGDQVSLDTLFHYPSIRSTLVNGLDCNKLFTMNIRQEATFSRSDPNKILSAQILDIEASEHRKTTKPVETIDLLSDDEDKYATKNIPTDPSSPKNACDKPIKTAAHENQTVKASPSVEEIRSENTSTVTDKPKEAVARTESVEACSPIEVITPDNVVLKIIPSETGISQNVSNKIMRCNDKDPPVKTAASILPNNTSINTDNPIKTILYKKRLSGISLNIETGLQKNVPIEIVKPNEKNPPVEIISTISKGRPKNAPIDVDTNMDKNEHESPIVEMKPHIEIDSSKVLLVKKVLPKTKQIHSNVFDTEYGKFSVTSMNKDIFIKHQKKLNLKSQILLKKVDAKPKKVDGTNLKPPSIPNQYVKGLLKDIENNWAAEVKNAPMLIPGVVEIDDSSNDSLYQNQVVETISGDNTINALKNVLLQELGVDVKPAENKLQETLKNDDDDVVIIEDEVLSSSNPRKVLKLSDIPKGKSCSFEELNDEDQIRIRKQKCSIKLVRCDELVMKHEKDLITSVACDEQVVIPENIPIFESLDEKDQIMEVDERSSSPVIELFDVFVSMDNKTLEKCKPAEIEVAALSCKATWFYTKNILHLQCLDTKPSIQLRNSDNMELTTTNVDNTSNDAAPSCYASWFTTKSMLHRHNLANAQAKTIKCDLDISENSLLNETIPLSCDADWYTTKPILHLRNLSNFTLARDTECDEIICDDSVVAEMITSSCKANWLTSKSKLRLDYLAPALTNIMEYDEETCNDSRDNETIPLTCEANWITTKRMLRWQRFDNVVFREQNAPDNGPKICNNVTSPRVIPLSCEAQWFATKFTLNSQAVNVLQHIVSKIPKTRKVTLLKCDARWFSTKPTIHSDAMQKLQVVQLPLILNDLKPPQTNRLLQPSLVTLALKRAQDRKIIDQYRLLRQAAIRSPVQSLKRKSSSQKITGVSKMPKLSGTNDVETSDCLNDTPACDVTIVSDQDARPSVPPIEHTISHVTTIIYNPEIDETTKSTCFECTTKTVNNNYNSLESNGDQSFDESNDEPIMEQQIHSDENIPLSSESDTNDVIERNNPDDSCTPFQNRSTIQFVQFELHIPDSIAISPPIEKVSSNENNDFNSERSNIEDNDGNCDNIEGTLAEIVSEPLVEEKKPDSNLMQSEAIDGESYEYQSSHKSNDGPIMEQQIHADENIPLSSESDANDKIESKHPDDSCTLSHTRSTIQFELHIPDLIKNSTQIEKVSSNEVNNFKTETSNIKDKHRDGNYDNIEETLAVIICEPLVEEKNQESNLVQSEAVDGDNSEMNALSYELAPNNDDNETEANDDCTKQLDGMVSLEDHLKPKDHVYHSTRSPTSLLDFVDDNKDQVIFIPTSNIIFLSEDEQINELEEEIVEMASDEIVDDFVFDIATSTILDKDCTSQLIEDTDLDKSFIEDKEKCKPETIVESCIDAYDGNIKEEERILKQTSDLSAENIMSKYMKLIQNDSDEFQNVVEYEDPENGTFYIIPVVKKPLQTGFSPIKKIDEKSEIDDVNKKAVNRSHHIEAPSRTVEVKSLNDPEGDDIESKLAEIVGESSADVENQSNVISKTVSSPLTDVEDIISQLKGIDRKNTSDKIAKRKRRSNKSITRTNKIMGSKFDKKVEFSLDNIEILKVKIPKRTYGRNAEHIVTRSRSLKRKMDMSDTKTSEKKYRKGKNIDYPRFTAAAKFETVYSKEYKCLLDYCSSVKFSYAIPFHKEYIDVHTLSKSWPIKATTPEPAVTPEESNEELFTELEKSEALPDPMQQTLFEEISSEFDETSYTPTNIHETNFKMGFGEWSGRVILESKDGELTTFSAATLSDVKQLQPLLPSDEKEKNIRKDLTNDNREQRSNARRFMDHLNLRHKVQEFFEKSRAELYMESMLNNKKDNHKSNDDWLIGDLTSTRCFRPPPVEIGVNVVQVGQLPVSAAAQNPVTCDPRVTHVSNASPSQCSPENGMADELQTPIKTEYTELTTANITLPMMQEYVQHHHSSESQEPSNVYSPNDNMTMSTEIKSVVKIELMEETSQEEEDENVNYENNGIQQRPNGNINTSTQYQYENASNNLPSESISNQAASNLSILPKISGTFSDDRLSSDTVEKSDQLAHAMNAAGIPAAKGLVKSIDTMPQHPHPNVTISQANTNNFPKTTPMNAIALQQALAQILPQSFNQISSENNAQSSTNPQVLHIVQGNNTQSVINKPNGTQLLHIVQNKSVVNSNSTPTPQQSISGLSLYDGSIQQGGNQLLHIVNTGNQKNTNAGQLLKRVNLLTNLSNVQGANEQKMVQFVCKSADGKSIQLPHQRSMVLRLQPLDPSTVPATPKQNDNQDHSSSAGTSHSAVEKESSLQEMKSRSLYEENYAKFVQSDGKFVQNEDSKQGVEKATSLPKFNQVFGKQVYQDKPEELESESLPQNPDPPEENNAPLEQVNDITNPPMLIRKVNPPQPSHVQPNLVQQIKQTIGPMNIQTMHGGVIYTRQIPVNIGNGQTINLITVPSTELVDDSVQKQQTDAKYENQEGDPPIIKIVPTNQPGTTPNAAADDNTTQARTTTEASPQPNPQPQPVLTQMRIKLPMLSKAPQIVGGTRVVRPSFFQIQRNVIGGANQQVYQQLVLTAAPPLGQSIRLPAQVQKPKTPSETQSSPESQMSTSTLEQLREFDMVLEQVKERSTVQPGTSTSSTNNFTKLKSSPDTTDAPTPSTSTQESPTQVLYSVGNTQPLNIVNYVTRKSTITSTTASTFARSPDSTGTVESPSSSTHSHLTHTVTSDSCASSSCASEAAAATAAQPKPKKKKPKPSTSTSNPFNIKNTPKPSSQKPLEDEQTTQRILYILAEYKEQVENSPDKDKPAPRRRNNPAAPNAGSSKRKKSSSGSRRRDMSPVLGEDSCRTMGSEDSSCGTSLGECNECLETHSPEESPKKVVRRLTFEQETQITQTRTTTTTTTVPQRNVIVTDGQAFAVRGATGKPATTVLMPANYLLPVSMVKGGQQIAIVTNRGPKLLVGAGEGGTGGTLLFQRLIGPGGLKPVLARPGVRHIRLPTAALQNLQAFNIATPATATVQPPDSTASPAPAPTPPDLVDTRAMSSPWPDRDAGEVKPERGNSSPEGSEPWNLPSSSIADDYGYEEIVRTDNMDRTVLDAIPDRYSPDLEAQRIFDKMFDCDSKKSIYDSRCGYDVDASDDDKPYHQVVHRKDGRHTTRLTHVSAAALRHKYAILEHELRLQKSLSEECEDLGVDSPSASELFPEAELLFAPSPAHEQTIDQCHTPQPTIHMPSIPQPDIDDQIATDQLLTHKDRQEDLDINLDDVGEIVTVGEDGMTTIPLDHEEFARSHEEFARSHPNTTFHTEPEDGEVPPFTIAQGVKGRQISFHPRGVPGTVVMAPQTTVISQATVESAGTHNTVKFSDIDNMINAMPSPQHNLNMPSVLVKDGNESLNKFDRLLNESRDINLASNPASVVHSTGNGTQVIRRVQYENRRDSRYMVEDTDAMIGGESKMTDERRDLQSIDDNSSSERQELFWEQSRLERKRFDFSSDSDKCCKSPFDEAHSDSSGIGAHTRLDSVIKAARPERRRSDGSSAEESHPPLRTYPAKRTHQHGHHSHHPSEVDRSLTGKTRATDRCHDVKDESKRRASNRGVVKRGCHCCNGSSTAPKPKKSRPKKSNDYPHN